MDQYHGYYDDLACDYEEQVSPAQADADAAYEAALAAGASEAEAIEAADYAYFGV